MAEGTEAGKDTKKALLEHLQELRKILIAVIIVVGVAFGVIFGLFRNVIIDFITVPLTELGIEPIYTALTEALNVQMKVSLLAACIVSFPVVAFLIWRFIRPALYPKERKTFIIALIAAILLFAGGVVFAYWAVFTLAVNFFIFIGEGTAIPMISITRYVSFLVSFLIPFGIVFLLPLFSYILTRLGILTHTMMSKQRKYILLGIFVAAAILTPPDVLSQLFMAGPMIALFEVSILISRRVKVSKERQAAMEAKKAAKEGSG